MMHVRRCLPYVGFTRTLINALKASSFTINTVTAIQNQAHLSYVGCEGNHNYITGEA